MIVDDSAEILPILYEEKPECADNINIRKSGFKYNAHSRGTPNSIKIFEVLSHAPACMQAKKELFGFFISKIGFNNNGMKEQGINWFMLEIINKETGEKNDVKCNNQEISSKDWKNSVLEPVVEAISKMDNTIPFERRDNIKDEIAEDIIENIEQDRDGFWYTRDNLR